MPHIIVGTAGHIDHGKTALVKALTGIDADRLKEEKARGITIDIGFANLKLGGDTTIGFIDVPGHERFVRNMLAGVGGIDVVMLVVAADESVMPQTREHLEICSLLRIKRGLTVLTKIDATDRELVDLAEMETLEFLRGSFLQDSPVLRVSAHTGDGIPELTGILREYAHQIPPRDTTRVFRLPIDRAFTMRGFGTVVSGTLIAGRVRQDEEVAILPHRRQGRVRGIQVHGAAVAEARAGQRTALNLQRIEHDQVTRGMIAAPPGVFTPTAMFDVHLELLPSSPSPIVRRKRVRFHVGTAELIGYVVLIGQETLMPGDAAVAQVRLEEETFALPGDRFIIRQYSPMTTLGGGEILDAHPRRHRRSDAAVRARLDRLAGAPMEDRLLALIEDAGLRAVSVADVVGRFGLSAADAAAQMHSLARSGRIRVVSHTPTLTAVHAAAFARATAAVEDEVRRFHAAEPLLRGIGREDLKGRVLRNAPDLLFRAAIDHLVESRHLAVDQDLVHVHDRAVTLGGEEARIRTLLADRFRAAGLQAPPVDDLIASLELNRQVARKIVQLMIKEGALVKVNDSLTVDRDALHKLIEDLQSLKRRTAKLGVREFKELTGLSRKFAVPLLEYLDGQRVTRRVGDDRLIL